MQNQQLTLSRPAILLSAILLCLLAATQLLGAEVQFDSSHPGRLQISVAGHPLASYVYKDPEIPRPYFAAVHTPGGVQVTRPQPPDPRRDIADHPTFHPGIWLAFGDLSGNDYWRNAAQVQFVDFPLPARSRDNEGEFTARFHYLAQQGSSTVACEERFHCRIVTRPEGILLVWDSTFQGEREFTFGDQEEMGLGFRIATGLRSERQPRGEIGPGNGTILDSAGRKNGAEIWGHTADWCDFSGSADGQWVGMTLLCHPQNFRPSWFHARDYGLLVANPFGRQAFHQGDTSRVVVQPGDFLRLRYGILLHACPTGGTPDLAAAYRDYLTLTAEGKTTP